MTRTPEQKKALNDVLQRGVNDGDANMMRLSLEKGADPDLFITASNERGSFGRLDANLLSLALRQGADANLMLFAAIKSAALPIVKIAVEQGSADVNCTHAVPGRTDTKTIGDWAYENFNTSVSDYLFSRGMNVDMKGGKGMTPLLRAVNDADYSKVMHYLGHGANPFIGDDRGNFPLQTLEKGSYSYGSTFGEKKNEILRAMLKNVPDETPATPAAATPADAFNTVAIGEDIEINRPLELKKAPAPPADPPRKGFQL
ncbi:MAG: ankyrin repeat domain-containing protein [Alphaproteobacteria bacterium]|nr:MAG: ankyrin repeat domain-containing protein [Alphaproteobacteria bacterium]